MSKRILSGIVGLMCLLSGCRKAVNVETNHIPLFHFTTVMNWTGEPAGLVYDDELYHLFYQYNPSGNVFGNIHWGHAVSRDLFRWQRDSIALFPDSLGYLKSGSVVVDKENTSGFGSEMERPFLAFYTYANPDLSKTLFSAYSLDKGRTWIKQGEIDLPNPVECDLRNPHVSWYEEYGRWIMTVSSGSSVLFYASSDCKEWHFLSEFKDATSQGANWEGTDFFPMKVQGKEIKKWVLLVNMENGLGNGTPSTCYYIGDFDGTSFQITQTKELWLDYGKDNYAGSTFSGLNGDDRIFLGWMSCWEYANLLPTSVGRGNMIIPRRLGLVEEGRHYMLASVIPSGLSAFYADSCLVGPVKLSDENGLRKEFPYPGESFVMRLNFDNSDNRAIWKADNYGIRLKTRSGKVLTIGYQNELSYYYIDRSGLEIEPSVEGFEQLMGAGYRSETPVSDWLILFDQNSIELFASGGRVAMTSLCYPDDEFTTFELYAESGAVNLLKASIIQLKNELIK